MTDGKGVDEARQRPFQKVQVSPGVTALCLEVGQCRVGELLPRGRFLAPPCPAL